MSVDGVSSNTGAYDIISNEVDTETSSHRFGSLRGSNSESTLKLRVMLAVLEWMETQQDAQKGMEKEQEAKKKQHWELVMKRCKRMKDSQWSSFAGSVAGAVMLGAGAALGYHAQGLQQQQDPSATYYQNAAGALQGFGQLPDKWFEGVKSQREADTYLYEQEAQRAEKSSQGQSSKVQKSERIEDNAQSFFKQMNQTDSQLNDAVSNMVRAH